MSKQEGLGIEFMNFGIVVKGRESVIDFDGTTALAFAFIGCDVLKLNEICVGVMTKESVIFTSHRTSNIEVDFERAWTAMKLLEDVASLKIHVPEAAWMTTSKKITAEERQMYLDTLTKYSPDPKTAESAQVISFLDQPSEDVKERALLSFDYIKKCFDAFRSNTENEISDPIVKKLADAFNHDVIVYVEEIVCNDT